MGRRARFRATGRTAMTLNAHKDWVTQCCFSPDGHRIISVSRDKTARMWDSHIGHKIATFQGHLDWLTDISIAFDSEICVTSSGDQTLKIWDMRVDEWGKLFTLRGHTDWVSCCTHSPVEYRIVSGSRDKTVRLWDTTTAANLLTLHGHQWEVSSTAFSPDGNMVASGSWDRLVKLWDSRGGKKPMISSFDGHIDWVNNLSISGDGMYVASCSADRRVNIWDLRTSKILTCFRNHTAAVNDVHFYPNGQFVASCSDDRTVRVWDMFSGVEMATLTGHTEAVTGLSWGNEQRYIISSSRDHTVRLWDVSIEKLPSKSHHQRVGSAPIHAAAAVTKEEASQPPERPLAHSLHSEPTESLTDTDALSLPIHRSDGTLYNNNTNPPPKRMGRFRLSSHNRQSTKTSKQNSVVNALIDAPVEEKNSDAVHQSYSKTISGSSAAPARRAPTIVASPPSVKTLFPTQPVKPADSTPQVNLSLSPPTAPMASSSITGDSGLLDLLNVKKKRAGRHKRGKSIDMLGKSVDIVAEPGKKAKKRFSELFKSKKKSSPPVVVPTIALTPEPPAGPTVIGTFLQQHHLGQYEEMFLAAGFDGANALQLLTEMTEGDMKEIGMQKLGHRRMLMAAIQAQKKPRETPRRNMADMFRRSNSEIEEFFERLAETLNINRIEEYAELDPETIRKHGGGDLLAQFNDSYRSLLTAVYPDVNWRDVIPSSQMSSPRSRDLYRAKQNWKEAREIFPDDADECEEAEVYSDVNHSEELEPSREGLDLVMLENVIVGRVVETAGSLYFYDRVSMGMYNKLPALIKFMSADFLERFYPEGEELSQALLQMDSILKNAAHPNLVSYQGIINVDGQYALVQSVPKIKLTDWLESEADEYVTQSLPPAEQFFLAVLCGDITRALEHMNTQQLLVGTISAQRVYLSYNFQHNRLEGKLDGCSEITISYLLCKLCQCKIPKSVKLCPLNVAFCAPEVLLQRKFSSSSDVWSLGVFFWEAWNLGATPYMSVLDERSSESVQNFVNYICQASSPKLSIANQPDVNEILSKCLRVTPSQRGTAQSLGLVWSEIGEKLKAKSDKC